MGVKSGYYKNNNIYMCGIVGYLGKGDAYPALIKGLKRLEYRGYDSAGVALIGNDGSLNVYKAKGKVASLASLITFREYTRHVPNGGKQFLFLFSGISFTFLTILLMAMSFLNG